MYVILEMNNKQITKALREGLIRNPTRTIKLEVDEDVIQDLRDDRLYVTERGELKLYESVTEEYSAPELTFGGDRKIVEKLVDYIIDNKKTKFDRDCLAKYYEIVDEEIKNIKQKIDEKREKERKIEEVRELLKDEITLLKNEIDKLSIIVSLLSMLIRKTT